MHKDYEYFVISDIDIVFVVGVCSVRGQKAVRKFDLDLHDLDLAPRSTSVLSSAEQSGHEDKMDWIEPMKWTCESISPRRWIDDYFQVILAFVVWTMHFEFISLGRRSGQGSYVAWK